MIPAHVTSVIEGIAHEYGRLHGQWAEEDDFAQELSLWWLLNDAAAYFDSYETDEFLRQRAEEYAAELRFQATGARQCLSNAEARVLTDKDWFG